MACDFKWSQNFDQHCKVWSDLTNSLPFLVRPEYTLSLIGLIRPSFETHNRLLVEPSPCSIITSLGAWLRITQFFTFLPLGTTINRVLLKCFHYKMVVKTLEGLPDNLVMLHHYFWEMYNQIIIIWLYLS
jgi:hypothetical protein